MVCSLALDDGHVIDVDLHMLVYILNGITASCA